MKTLLKKIGVVFALTFLGYTGYAQYGYGMYNGRDIDAFPKQMQYKEVGWYFGIGPTFTPPLTYTFYNDKVNQRGQNPKSATGLFIELGKYKIFKYDDLFKYMDYGLAYKSLRGREMNTGGKFADHYIEGHFNLNRVKSLTNSIFLQHTLGLNAEYAILRKSSGAAPSAFVTSLHYKLGLGVRITKNLMVIPSLEIPITTFLPFEGGRGTLGYMSSRYRPLVFSVRFLLLKEDKMECPYVPPPPGGLPNKDGSNNGGLE